MKFRQTVATLGNMRVYRRCKWHQSDVSQAVWFWICLVAPIAAVAVYFWVVSQSVTVVL